MPEDAKDQPGMARCMSLMPIVLSSNLTRVCVPMM